MVAWLVVPYAISGIRSSFGNLSPVFNVLLLIVIKTIENEHKFMFFTKVSSIKKSSRITKTKKYYGEHRLKIETNRTGQNQTESKTYFEENMNRIEPNQTETKPFNSIRFREFRCVFLGFGRIEPSQIETKP